MKRQKFHTRLGAALLALCLCVALPAFGEDMGGTSSVGFTVRACLPSNQLGDGSYFNLLIHPYDRQVVEIEIVNQLDEPLTVSISINDATTNQNGLIVYPEGDADATYDPLQLSALAMLRLDSLQTDPNVTLLDGHRVIIAPRASVRVPIEIVMPEQPIVGQLLGGIVVTKLDEAPAAAGASFAVRSVYTYAIALQLQSETEHAFAPDIAIGEAQLTSVAGWDALTVSLHNNAPLVITGAQLGLRVMEPGTQAVLFALQRERVSLSPLATLPFTATLPEDMGLTPGRYTVAVDWIYDGQTTSMQTELVIEDA